MYPYEKTRRVLINELSRRCFNLRAESCQLLPLASSYFAKLNDSASGSVVDEQ